MNSSMIQKLTTASAFALILGMPALAQQTTVFETQNAADDAVKTVEKNVEDSFAKSSDSDRFTFGRNAQGWRGSFAATASMTSGNSDNVTAGFGTRLGYAMGQWDHDFVASFSYTESNGVETGNKFVGAYDATRYLNGDLYAFGSLRYSADQYASITKDLFAGAGIGYRLINNDDLTWRVQAGPGLRKASYSNGTKLEEAAGILSSKLWYQINDGMSLTNDTTVLHSSSDTMVANELGVNMSLNGPLALRTSLTSEYHSDPLAGAKNTDHLLGVSLVYSFN